MYYILIIYIYIYIYILKSDIYCNNMKLNYEMQLDKCSVSADLYITITLAIFTQLR